MQGHGGVGLRIACQNGIGIAARHAGAALGGAGARGGVGGRPAGQGIARAGKGARSGIDPEGASLVVPLCRTVGNGGLVGVVCRRAGIVRHVAKGVKNHIEGLGSPLGVDGDGLG